VLQKEGRDMGTYKRVEGLARGLTILRLLNSFEGGRATVPDVAEASGLHRTTVKRILETLCAEGYVVYQPRNKTYTLGLNTRQLSEGFTDEAWIVSIANPALAELQRQVIWPTDLATPQGDRMVIRETTRRFSPFSFHRSMVGMHIPMISTSVGRAYLAYCTPQQRGAIAAYVTAKDPDGQDMQAILQGIAKSTRERGYGSSFGDWPDEDRFGAIAVPIMTADHVWGCINVVFLLRSMAPSDAIRKFTTPLWETSKQISKELEAASHSR